MMRPVGFIACFLLLLTFHTDATVFVSKQGNNTDGQSWETAFHTINQALIVAVTAESVWVSKGGYDEAIRIDKPIKLFGGFEGNERSEDFPLHNPQMNETIISGGTAVRVIRARTEFTLDGFTISRGVGADGYGGDIGNCSGVIRRCSIVNNRYEEGTGAGLFIFNSQVHLDHCVIQNNSAAELGGGIYASESDLTITNCIIRNNEARYVDHYPFPSRPPTAGGLQVARGRLRIENTILANNRLVGYFRPLGGSEIHGGVFEGGAILKNCVIYSKEAESIIYIPGDYEPLAMENCIVWGNPEVLGASNTVTLSYTNTYKHIEGPGNISEDPLFVDPDNGDFHLMPDSPCIDAGTDVGLTSDLDGNPRPIGRYDMGAYEFPYLPGDLNGDDVVDAMDLLILMEDWMKVTGP